MCEKKFEIATRTFKNKFNTESLIKQTIFAIGLIIASTDDTNPPKLITDKNGIIATFANNEYVLIVLK